MAEYYESIVLEWLRADRGCFVNTQYMIQISDGDAPRAGTSWYCDALAVDFSNKLVLLCEVSYSQHLWALRKRLQQWEQNWDAIKNAIRSISNIPADWKFKVWVFVPNPEYLDSSKRPIAENSIADIKKYENKLGLRVRWLE